MARPRAWMSWSSGKDSAMALHHVLEAGHLEVVGLLTTVNGEADRVAMHGVRRSLLEAQANVLGLPLSVVELPWPCSNEEYERRMAAAIAIAANEGVTAMVFGDLFLEDVRAYREAALSGTGVIPHFPLWQRPTAELARELIDVGFRAVITCVDLAQLPLELAGRWFDESLLADLPASADPCGERGEFHSLVVDSPDFDHPLAVSVGQLVERDGFAFADVLPASDRPAGSSECDTTRARAPR